MRWWSVSWGGFREGEVAELEDEKKRSDEEREKKSMEHGGNANGAKLPLFT
jgi:hypothetical protein